MSNEELLGRINEIIGCFDAACLEGLQERLADCENKEVGSLYDLLGRRILPAFELACDIRNTLQQQGEPLTPILGATSALRSALEEALPYAQELGQLYAQRGLHTTAKDVQTCVVKGEQALAGCQWTVSYRIELTPNNIRFWIGNQGFDLDPSYSEEEEGESVQPERMQWIVEQLNKALANLAGRAVTVTKSEAPQGECKQCPHVVGEITERDCGFPDCLQQPTELEMHRADYAAIKAAGFESPGELLAAYKRLSEQPQVALVRQFPIQDWRTIPWSLIEPWERQAYSNHGQSLERLAQRGGLGMHEALAVLTGRHFRETLALSDEECRQQLTKILNGS